MVMIKYTFVHILLPISDYGINGKIDVHVARCFDPTSIGLENVPRNDCGDVNDIYDMDQIGQIYNATSTRSTGSSCSCEEDGCNLLSKLCGRILIKQLLYNNRCNWCHYPVSNEIIQIYIKTREIKIFLKLHVLLNCMTMFHNYYMYATFKNYLIYRGT